ncbi:hypothetical protein [Streptococcus jiangjianxini]|uniref:hypothetical protein n=1 Tax=Streptococcus jiangjianxini TaxID=3161189 RepID=UPI0032EF6E2D
MERTLKQIKNELTKLKQTAEAKITELENDYTALSPEIEQAKKSIIEAKKNIDKEAYNKAKDELWTLENTKELLSDNLNELRHSPLVDKEKYQSLYHEIIEVSDKKIDETTKKLELFFVDLEKIGKEYNDTLALISETLGILQNQIGKNSEEFKKDERGYINSEIYLGLRYKPKSNPAYLVDQFIKQYKEMTK